MTQYDKALNPDLIYPRQTQPRLRAAWGTWHFSTHIAPRWAKLGRLVAGELYSELSRRDHTLRDH